MKPRAKKKKFKKRFPYSDEFKQHKNGYMERLHKCPVCGGFEWKEKTCEDIIEDMKNMKKMLI